MGVFYLKYRDTLPALVVTLHDPAPEGSAPGTVGPVHDLTGSSAWFLNIELADGTRLQRAMTKVGLDADGKLTYAWLATDWDAGGLVASPDWTKPAAREHRMEYEVRDAGPARLTFPNDSYDTLRIADDLGQG